MLITIDISIAFVRCAQLHNHNCSGDLQMLLMESGCLAKDQAATAARLVLDQGQGPSELMGARQNMSISKI